MDTWKNWVRGVSKHRNTLCGIIGNLQYYKGIRKKIPHWENKMQVKEMEITKKLSVKESSKEREYFIKGHKNRIVS